MANTSNILMMAFAIVFLASLSVSSGFAKHNSDILNAFEKRLDHELQPLLREKRQKEADVFLLRNNSPLKLEEELSESKPVYEKRAVYAEEAKEIDQIDQHDETRKQGEQEKPRSVEPEMSNTIDEEGQNAQDDVFSYKNMHDLIQILILADEEDIAERLQQLREMERAAIKDKDVYLQNTTKSETLNNLPKRQAVASASASAAAAAAAAPSSDLLGANLWDVVPLVDLDAHSCEVEAFSHGHSHVSGTIVHEFFCELRKFWHYGLIVLRNFKSELTLGPLVIGDAVSGGIFGHLFHHASHLLHTVIREPHHLLILPDIIRDAVPFASLTGALHRVKDVFFKVLHFGLGHVRGHIRHVLTHLFSHRHRGVHLREKHLHHLQRFGSVLPLEEIVAEPIVSAAASSTATATATATAAASSDGSIVIPDYHRSLAELLSSFRGFYDGYYASGVPHLIRTGAKSFSESSVFSSIRSYLSRIPFSNYFGCVQQGITASSVSSASVASSVGVGGSPVVGPAVGPLVSPVMEPTIVSVPVVVPVETEAASSLASTATATATATVAETHPLFSVGPTIVPSVIPYESASSNTVAAAVSPTVSDYHIVPLIQPVPALTPAVVSNTVSESSSVAIAAPEVAVPAVLEDTVVTSSAAASSAANVVSTPDIVGRVPLRHFASSRRHRPRPIATASASASSTNGRTLLHPAQYRGLDLDIDRRIRYPLIRPRDFSVIGPSSAAASAATSSTSVSDGSLSAAAAAAAAAASSSASSVSSGGFNLVLPREQIVGALGYDYLLPGDVITVTLRNKSILFGRVLDAASPITFNFLRPKLRASLLRHGGRLWNLLPRDFRDPECIRKFNNPLLLRYGH